MCKTNNDSNTGREHDQMKVLRPISVVITMEKVNNNNEKNNAVWKTSPDGKWTEKENGKNTASVCKTPD